MSIPIKNVLAALTLGLIGVSAIASTGVITCPQTISCSANNIQSCKMNDNDITNFFIRDGEVNFGTYTFDNTQSSSTPSISSCGYKRENSLIGEQNLVIIAKKAASAYVVPGSSWKPGYPICKADSSTACRLSTSN